MQWPRLTQTRVILGIATLLSLYSAFQAFQYVAFFAQRPTSIWLILGLVLYFAYGVRHSRLGNPKN